MLFTTQVVDEHKDITQDNRDADIFASISERRSSMPAVTHVDFSARLQTVDGKFNPRFYNLLKLLKKPAARF